MPRLLPLPRVLADTPSRSILLRLVGFGLFELRWTSAIIDAAWRMTLANNPQLRPLDLVPVFDSLRDGCPGADVLDEEVLSGEIPLWAEGYEILAAAAAGNVDAILVFHRRQLPMQNFDAPVMTLDELLQRCWREHTAEVLLALMEKSVDLSHPLEKMFEQLRGLYPHAPVFVKELLNCAPYATPLIQLYREFGGPE